MFGVGIGGSPDENYENLIRASRKSAPSQEEFEMEQLAAEIEADRAAKLNRGVRINPEGAFAPARRPARPFKGIRLPEERGGTAMGRHISRQAEEARGLLQRLRERNARQPKNSVPSPPTPPLPPVGPLNQQAPTPRPF